jgi:hypothetical protein
VNDIGTVLPPSTYVLLLSTDRAEFLNYEQIIIHICPRLVVPALQPSAFQTFCRTPCTEDGSLQGLHLTAYRNTKART